MGTGKEKCLLIHTGLQRESLRGPLTGHVRLARKPKSEGLSLRRLPESFWEKKGRLQLVGHVSRFWAVLSQGYEEFYPVTEKNKHRRKWALSCLESSRLIQKIRIKK